MEKATEHKQGLEQRQREEAKERKEKGLKVETKVGQELFAFFRDVSRISGKGGS